MTTVFANTYISGLIDEITMASGSIYFNGSSYLSVPYTSAFDFGAGDFTVEFWMYSNTGSNICVMAFPHNASNLAPVLIYNPSGNTLQLYSSSDGSSWNVASGVSIGTFNVNAWNHVAISKSGSSIRLFMNGNLTSTVTFAGTFGGTYDRVWIGASAGNSSFNGYLSNVRIVRGIASYTANFIPPASTLPAIANTSLLLTVQPNNPFQDTSNNNLAITKVGTPTFNNVGPFNPAPPSTGTSQNIPMKYLKDGTVMISGYYDEVGLYVYSTPSLFYSDGSSLTGWTNSGITIDSSIGNPINSFKSTGSSQYAYINPGSITSFVGKTIQVDMRATAGTALVGIYFGCNVSGAGQIFRLDCRGSGSGFAACSSWTSWSAPGGAGYTAATWYTVKIQINSTATNGMSYYINGTLVGTGTFVDNGPYFGLQGDGGSGGNWDNIYVYNGII
jgi:hypothetical protein